MSSSSTSRQSHNSSTPPPRTYNMEPEQVTYPSSSESRTGLREWLIAGVAVCVGVAGSYFTMVIGLKDDISRNRENISVANTKIDDFERRVLNVEGDLKSLSKLEKVTDRLSFSIEKFEGDLGRLEASSSKD